MTITENNFQSAVKFGGIALAVCAVLNVYLVMRNREVYRDQVQTETRFQQLALQVQAIEAIAREFVGRANADPKIAEILLRHQVIGRAEPQPSQVTP